MTQKVTILYVINVSLFTLSFVQCSPEFAASMGQATAQQLDASVLQPRLHDLDRSESLSSKTSPEYSHRVSLEQTKLLQQQSATTPQYIYEEEELECPSFGLNVDTLTQDKFSTILTDECRYDKLSKPDVPNPIPIYVHLHLKHIETGEQLFQQFKMDVLIQYRYTDYRLNYEEISPYRKSISGEELLKNRIWIPHLILGNERDSSLMGLTGGDYFVNISPKGEVTLAYRMTARIYCWMDLKKFPFDTQTCEITLRGWTYNASNLILEWDEELPARVEKQLHLTEFTFESYRTFSRLETSTVNNGPIAGNYSFIVLEFVLAREIGYYLLDYFIPSTLLVVTSWVTFWLQADNAAPRITLGTSTMLAFITLGQGQNRHLPKVSYIKASEIWFLACVVFIFASMVEFAFVNIIWRRRKKVELKKVNSKYILKSTLTPRLARKELLRSSSMNNLHKSHSCSSLTSNDKNKENASYNNYLTVHSFPSGLNIPTITTQSEDDLVTNSSQVTIAVPNKSQDHEQHAALQKWTSMTPQEVAMWIDKRSRIVFPCAFLVFNIFYWSFVYAL